ncbi:MAG: 16S rRNA (guanine(966)-N(2))-methyltransferase RsmD [Firmicutes bacterium]|jgi:16S rRNA (guanine(966)-N(2))-methyltransferase RsmD|nr:16S rRNA (guanine(966)-N(2))-methyltransferase RsmD [Bacillota bacterium]
MIRVIGGEYGRRRLLVPKSVAVRPTSDRTREAIFNILASRIDLVGKKVLDLFAGSGALGIEAISRGATEAVFVDSSHDSLVTIKQNVESLGCRETAVTRVIKSDVVSYLTNSDEVFDVAFCDPPYKFLAWSQVLNALHSHLAVLESDREVIPTKKWETLKTYSYGISVVTVVRQSDQSKHQ